ncbi:NADPH-dependent F420 reductase [Iamia majanohamensis]|uniref:NADPH-dependent F420 reductase n=1 Tax=Iamia majanohamensis TaxID=467976 RepID=A0AAE9Y8N3_9ACTN|nr:NADPH-dependent F420 reductase [Iamia majanohamensis]WCO68929.1 NADPH-dependent F420 reductase [Iamia majanohamensis]
MRIGVLGATGPAGSGLAVRLAAVGYEVVIGSRSKYRAMETADKLLERWPDRDLHIEAADNEGAAEADVVVIATPWDAAATTAEAVGDQLAGKVVISMANALAKVGHEFQPLVPPRGSVAASVQAAVPRSHVAAAFHHVPAKELGDIAHPIESDVLVCSDHPEATEKVLDIVSSIPDLRGLDSGELSNAAPIEAFAAVLLQVNVRYKTRVAVRFTGLDDKVGGGGSAKVATGDASTGETATADVAAAADGAS